MKELIFEKTFERDGLLEFLKNEVDILSDDNNLLNKKCDKKNREEIIDVYKSFSELVKEDKVCTEYTVKVFKERNGDAVTFSTNIKEL